MGSNIALKVWIVSNNGFKVFNSPKRHKNTSPVKTYFDHVLTKNTLWLATYDNFSPKGQKKLPNPKFSSKVGITYEDLS